MKKNQIIILVIVVLIFGGSFALFLSQKSKIPSEGVTSEAEETFSFTAVVSKVDVENNYLVVKPKNQENEIKVILSETTKLVKLEFPFDPANPPKEGTFTPKQTEVEISDFEAGDNIFIKAKENIAGKSEFGNIDFIHILP